MTIEDTLADIRRRIARAARAAGRDDAGGPAVMAVTKTQSDAAVDAALAAGIRLFGENRVQEAKGRWTDARRGAHPDIRLHLIGPLQTNKTDAALALFDVIESLDRESLARALAAAIPRLREEGTLRTSGYLVQVNTGEEPQKAGIAPRELAGFLDYCRHDCALPVEGLMCIPPVGEPAALHFAFLKTLARRHGLSVLSMGMSDDFEKAAALGATHVRLGSILFGAREA